MNILMVSKSSFETDIRIRREAEALVRAGHQVTALTLGEPTGSASGVTVIGLGDVTGLARGGSHRGGLVRRTGRWLLLPDHRDRAMRQFQARVMEVAEDLETTPDVVHAHDFPALEPCVSLSKSWKSSLVYDTHEFWSGMPRYGRPEPVRRRRNRSDEHRLIQQAAVVITVSDDAAELLESRFGVRDVVVVRNTFPARHDLTPAPSPIGAIYAGRIGAGRDLETVFAAPGWSSGHRQLHVMGPRDHRMEIPDFVRVHEAGSMDDVDRLLCRVGVGLVTLARGPLNHEIALPNKLFQAVSLGVPVVASNLPQIAKVVSKYNIGALYEPGDGASFKKALDDVFVDFAGFSANSAGAQIEFDWAIDATRLQKAYQRIG